ncbi:Uncharacterised protein [Serratia rubidaea]|uniref:Uncharacterized protein n=1 Tax=Serratia rubidaea TaxID=61652 RepID=A0A4U9HVI5_SERRU|nr:Uncharacterised protein [Serratia rubidaea]
MCHIAAENSELPSMMLSIGLSFSSGSSLLSLHPVTMPMARCFPQGTQTRAPTTGCSPWGSR